MDIARNIRIPSPYNKDLDEFIKENFAEAIRNAYKVENGNKIKFSDLEGEILFYFKIVHMQMAPQYVSPFRN